VVQTGCSLFRTRPTAQQATKELPSSIHYHKVCLKCACLAQQRLPVHSCAARRSAHRYRADLRNGQRQHHGHGVWRRTTPETLRSMRRAKTHRQPCVRRADEPAIIHIRLSQGLTVLIRVDRMRRRRPCR
jgi:hypothetical protein